MNHFPTYLKLKEKWTIPQFIDSLFEVYDIQYDNLNLQQKRIIEDYFDIYQYPQDQSVVIHLIIVWNTYIMKKMVVCVFIMRDIKKDIVI